MKTNQTSIGNVAFFIARPRLNCTCHTIEFPGLTFPAQSRLVSGLPLIRCTYTYTYSPRPRRRKSWHEFNLWQLLLQHFKSKHFAFGLRRPMDSCAIFIVFHSIWFQFFSPDFCIFFIIFTACYMLFIQPLLLLLLLLILPFYLNMPHMQSVAELLLTFFYWKLIVVHFSNPLIAMCVY